MYNCLIRAKVRTMGVLVGKEATKKMMQVTLPHWRRKVRCDCGPSHNT